MKKKFLQQKRERPDEHVDIHGEPVPPKYKDNSLYSFKDRDSNKNSGNGSSKFDNKTPSSQDDAFVPGHTSARKIISRGHGLATQSELSADLTSGGRVHQVMTFDNKNT